MNTCQETLEIYSAWIDGEATPSEVAEMEKHLGECPDCRGSADELGGLSRSIRDDSTDYLRVSSNSLAARVLVRPEMVGRWPSGREFLLSKVLPTIGVGAWSLAIVRYPNLFRAWPLWGLCAFLLAQRQTGGAGLRQAGPLLSSTLRPFGWGLLAMTVFPTSAMLAAFQLPKTSAEEPLGAGLAIAAATLAGALCGIWRQHCSAAAWNRWRLPLVIAGILFLCAGGLFSGAALAVALLAALWLVLRVNRDLADDHLEALPVVPAYFSPVMLLDVAGLFALYRFGQVDLTSLFSTDLALELHLGWLDGPAFFPLMGCAAWLLLRNPLACLLERCHGSKARWWVGGILGIALALVGWKDVASGSAVPAEYPGIALAGLVMGLLVASRAAKPLTPLRKSILAQRLRGALVLWLAAGLAVLTLPGLFNGWMARRWPGQPEPARAVELRKQPIVNSPADPLAVPARAKASDFLSEEVTNGLDADLRVDGRPERILTYLKENFKHIDQAMAAGAAAPSSDGRYADEVKDAVWLRVDVELLGEQKSKVAGFKHLQEALNWEATGEAWGPLSYGASGHLRKVLANRRLTTDQYRQLWQRYHTAGGGLPRLRAALDRTYASARQECLNHGAGEEHFNLPPGFYQQELAKVADYYLYLRDRVNEAPKEDYPDPPFPLTAELHRRLRSHLRDEQMVSADFETTLASLGVCLYRAEKGHFPARLEQVEEYLGRDFINYSTGKKVDYAVFNEQIVVVGRRGWGDTLIDPDSSLKAADTDKLIQFMKEGRQ